MKVVQSDIQILKSNKIFVRKSFDPTVVLTKNYFWYRNNIRVDIKTEENLEKEYQKTLIPTKTPNPSEEKGSIANLVKQFCKEKQYYDDGKKILEQFAEWAKANGETPEVDNPVPSIDNSDINWLIELSANWINKNYSKADSKRFELIKSKLQNGRETDKVEPFDIDQQRCIYAATDILRPELRAEVLKRLEIDIKGL